jgi:hypothetical protein
VDGRLLEKAVVSAEALNRFQMKMNLSALEMGEGINS